MIYFPMACDIVTPGRIKCIIELARRDKVIIGLLTTKAMKDYKTEIVPFKARLYVLDMVCRSIPNIRIVSQGTPDPLKNLKRYKCTHLASGDGFETFELLAMKELGVKPLNIILPSERGGMYDINKIKESL